MVATEVVPEVYVNVPPDKLDVGAVKVKLELPYAFYKFLKRNVY